MANPNFIIFVAILTVQDSYSYKFNEQSLEAILVRTFTERYVDGLAGYLRARGLLCVETFDETLLPPFPSEYAIDPTSHEVDFTIPDPPTRINGTLALTNDNGQPTVYGLDKIEEQVDYGYSVFTGRVHVNWKLKLPRVSLKGGHITNVNVANETSIVDVRGGGPLHVGVDNIAIQLDGIISAPVVGKMRMEKLIIKDLGLQNLRIDGGDKVYIIDGEKQTAVDWKLPSNVMETYFDTTWKDEERKQVTTEILRCSFDHIIHDCNVQALVDGDIDCLKHELKQSSLPKYET